MNDVVYLTGWYDEEHDGSDAFRWMGGDARCRVSPPAAAGAWLRVVASCGGAAPGPALRVFAGGALLGERRIRRGSFAYLFQLPGGTDDLSIEVDRTFRAAGDPRPLGLCVRSIEILDPEEGDAPLDAEGWFGWEYHEYFPFRWMGLEARVILPARVRAVGRFAAVPICSNLDDGSQIVTVRAGQLTLIEVPLLQDWHVYGFELPPAGNEALDLTFHVSRLLPPERRPGDERELGIRVGRFEVHADADRHAKLQQFFEWQRRARERAAPQSASGGSADERDVDGWFGWESGGPRPEPPFRWMGLEARVRMAPAERLGARFCSIPVFCDYDDLSQVLTVERDGIVEARIPLVPGWANYSVALPEGIGGDVAVVLRVNKLAEKPPPADDPRQLGLRVGAFVLHDDVARHRTAVRAAENAVRNREEYLAGATVLSSFPVSLGIDLYGKCNIKPPCVYCLWEHAKQREHGYVSVVVDDTVLAEYGDFLFSVQGFVNCSFGEPLLHPRISQVLELLGSLDKQTDLATNGQAFTPATVEALAGKWVSLCVSLDAARAETYARLRNDRWHDVLTGLIFLREARRRANWLPKVNMVFIPMKANLDDLESYFKLCRMVRANALVLRPLVFPDAPPARGERGGYRFEYLAEMLSRDELTAVFARCNEYSAKYGVPVANQFEFGVKD